MGEGYRSVNEQLYFVPVEWSDIIRKRISMLVGYGDVMNVLTWVMTVV